MNKLLFVGLFTIGLSAQIIVQPGSGGGAPTGTAGGGLGGSYPNPTVVNVQNSTLGTGYLSTTKTAGAGGTVANELCKIDSTGNCVLPALGDVGILGVAVSTIASGSSVEVATRGIVQCVADNTTIIGNVVIVGTTTAGACRDAGQSNATLVSNSVQIIGKVLTVATAGNPFSLQLYGPGHYGSLGARPLSSLGASLPAASSNTGAIYTVTDGPTCAGGGATAVTCTSDGTVWKLLGGGGGGDVTFSTLTDAATITWAIASALIANATVTLGGNRTLNITGAVNGGSYILKIVQDGTGSRGLILGSGCAWKVVNGGMGIITPSTAANSIDLLAFTYDGTNCYATLNKTFN